MDREDILNRVFESHDEEKHDHEADMARSQLMRTAEKAIALFKMIKSGDNLEGWTAAKITKAADYLDSVHNYMSYEMLKAQEQDRIKTITTSKDSYHEGLEEKLENKLYESEQAITEEEFEKLAEKKDACYHKVKSRYKVWPSAYASGALVQCRKVGAKNWGNKSKK